MSLSTKIPDTIFSSTTPVDKIVRVFTGSFNGATQTILHNDIWVFPIAHGLTRPVACDILFSTNGGTTWVDDQMVFSDSTNIYIWNRARYGSTSVAALAGTFTYKVYATWIDDYDTTNPLIDVPQYNDTKTQFDSRLNYQKIYQQGVTNGSATINHTLGYPPNVRIWFESFAGEVWRPHAGGASNQFLANSSIQSEAYISITSTAVQIIETKGMRVWYRIYYDKT